MTLDDIITPDNADAIIAVLDRIFSPNGEPWTETKIDSAGTAINELMLRFHEVRLRAGFKLSRIQPAPKHIRNYLETGGVRCPYPRCDSDDVEMRDRLDSDGTTERWMEMTCKKCDRDFTDHYKLVGVTLGEPTEEKP
jgi:hypothetical protein